MIETEKRRGLEMESPPAGNAQTKIIIKVKPCLHFLCKVITFACTDKEKEGNDG